MSKSRYKVGLDIAILGLTCAQVWISFQYKKLYEKAKADRDHWISRNDYWHGEYEQVKADSDYWMSRCDYWYEEFVNLASELALD